MYHPFPFYHLCIRMLVLRLSSFLSVYNMFRTTYVHFYLYYHASLCTACTVHDSDVSLHNYFLEFLHKMVVVSSIFPIFSLFPFSLLLSHSPFLILSSPLFSKTHTSNSNFLLSFHHFALTYHLALYLSPLLPRSPSFFLLSFFLSTHFFQFYFLSKGSSSL